MPLENKATTAFAGAASAVGLSLLFKYVQGGRKPQTHHKTNDVKFVSTGQSKFAVALARELPDHVFSEQSASYQDSVDSYYSQHSALQRPDCIVQPRTTEHVAIALRVLKPLYDASAKGIEDGALRFVIRSGGHAQEPSVSSLDGGIVFDLSFLNDIKVAADSTTTIIGSGNKWVDVYAKLDPLGLAVVGGRDADVGVGGLTLGGGISYLSPRLGMVCDNILDFEVVLADGSIVHATASHNADLWKALKGGSNNFGIVTHFTAKTVPLSKVWGGYFYWGWGQAEKLLRAFHEFNKPESFDEHAAGPILAFGYQQSIGMRGCSGSIIYTKPEKWPAVWQPFNKLWRFWSTAGFKTLKDASVELDAQAPHGFRQAVYTTTIKNDLESVLHCQRAFEKAMEKVKNVKNVQFPLVVQPLTAGIFRKGTPNVLGLESRNPKESLVMVLCCPNWTRPEDDSVVADTAKSMILDVETFAESRGAADRYRYMNYCAREQDPIGGYGDENLQFMRRVSRKYDPEGMFQRAVLGGFKLGIY